MDSVFMMLFSANVFYLLDMDKISTEMMNYTIKGVNILYYKVYIPSIPHHTDLLLAVLTLIIRNFIWFLDKKWRKKKALDTSFIYNSDCPICFGKLLIPLRAACGHAFCVDCLYSFIKLKFNRLKCTCPLCRKQLRELVLIKNDIYKSLEKDDLREIDFRVERMDTILHTFSLSDVTHILHRANFLYPLIGPITVFYLIKCAIFLYNLLKK